MSISWSHPAGVVVKIVVNLHLAGTNLVSGRDVLQVVGIGQVTSLVEEGPTFVCLTLGIYLIAVPLAVAAGIAPGLHRLTATEFVAALAAGFLMIALGSFLQLYRFRTLKRFEHQVTADYFDFEKERTKAASTIVSNATKPREEVKL